MIVSSWASSTIEEVAQCSPEGLRWSHLYISPNEKETISRIRRAEKEGFKALVITIDRPYGGRGHFTHHPLVLPPHIEYANVKWYINLVKNTKSKFTSQPGLVDKRTKLTWDFLSWLRSVLHLSRVNL